MTENVKDGPAQNLALCILMMILSGALRVAATLVLAYPEHQARVGESVDEPSPNSIHRRSNLLAAHVFLLFIAAGLGIVGTIYGPVAIAVPVQTGSQLIFNNWAMGLLLKMRSFNKIQRTGTYVVTLSVFLLVDVGPDAQDDQDAKNLLFKTNSIIWILILNLGIVLASIKTMQLLPTSQSLVFFADEELTSSDNSTSLLDNRQRNPRSGYFFLMLLAGVTLSNVAMATTGKCLGS